MHPQGTTQSPIDNGDFFAGTLPRRIGAEGREITVDFGPGKGSLVIIRKYSEAERETRRNQGKYDKDRDSMFLSKPVLEELLKISEEAISIADMKDSGYEIEPLEHRLGLGHCFRMVPGSPFSTIQRMVCDSHGSANSREVIFQCITFLKVEMIEFFSIIREVMPAMVNLLDVWKRGRSCSAADEAATSSADVSAMNSD